MEWERSSVYINKPIEQKNGPVWRPGRRPILRKAVSISRGFARLVPCLLHARAVCGWVILTVRQSADSLNRTPEARVFSSASHIIWRNQIRGICPTRHHGSRLRADQRAERCATDLDQAAAPVVQLKQSFSCSRWVGQPLPNPYMRSARNRIRHLRAV